MRNRLICQTSRPSSLTNTGLQKGRGVHPYATNPRCAADGNFGWATAITHRLVPTTRTVTQPNAFDEIDPWIERVNSKLEKTPGRFLMIEEDRQPGSKIAIPVVRRLGSHCPACHESGACQRPKGGLDDPAYHLAVSRRLRWKLWANAWTASSFRDESWATGI